MKPHKPSLLSQKYARLGNLLAIVILVLLPFHAFGTTWLGSNIGALDAVRLWKEVLLIVAAALALLTIIADKKQLWKTAHRDALPNLIILFVVFTLISTILTLIFTSVSFEAVMFGAVIQLRPFVAFLLLGIFSRYDDLLIRKWRQVLFIPAAIVIAFGLLQVTVLPATFLEYFGYGNDTIPAVQTIDEKQEFQRIQSTLRGANPLGAYLIVVLVALLAELWRKWQINLAALLAGGLIVLFFSYSRSAWLGLVVALLVLVIIRGKRYVTARNILFVTGAALIFLGGVGALRDNDFVQNTLFHSDENSVSEVSSNDARAQALTLSLAEVVSQPLGAGIGSAGPASFRNQTASPRIAENYFIQTAQEMGWIGLGLMIAVMVAAFRWLWQRKADTFGMILLASFLGITVVNLVSHAWADDTLAILWWGLFGAYYGHVILNKERKQLTKNSHETKKAARI
jgi:O-antigen ligase